MSISQCSYFLLIPPILILEHSTGFEPQAMIVCLSRPQSSAGEQPSMPKLQVATPRSKHLLGLDEPAPAEQQEPTCGSKEGKTIFLL